MSYYDYSLFPNVTNITQCEHVENATNEEYEQIISGTPGYILWGLIVCIITIVGSIGNILTILVLRRDPIMSTLTILLIALATSDLLAPLSNALLAFSHYHLQKRHDDSILFAQINDILRYVVQPLSTMFTMSSSWIIALTTLFRLIAVRWPFKARTLIDKRCAVLALTLIFSLSLLSILPIYANLETMQKCTSKTQKIYRGIDVNMTTFGNAYVPFMHFLCFYLPWLTSLTLWLFLLRSLRRSEKNFGMNSQTSVPGAAAAAAAGGSGRGLTAPVASQPTFFMSAIKPPPALQHQASFPGTLAAATTSSPATTKFNKAWKRSPGSGAESGESQSSSPKQPAFRRSFKSNTSKGGSPSQSTSTNEQQTEPPKVVSGSVRSEPPPPPPSQPPQHQQSSSFIFKNCDSRINRATIRSRSYNKITLMVVILCFTSLLCQFLTFIFIFENVANQIMMRNTYADYYRYKEKIKLLHDRIMDNFNRTRIDGSSSINQTAFNILYNEYYDKYQFLLNDNALDELPEPLPIHLSDEEYADMKFPDPFVDVRRRFPRFLSYSLLLNNIFLCINHSCNILIYMFTNPRFKRNLYHLLKQMLMCGKRSCFGIECGDANAAATTMEDGGRGAGGAFEQTLERQGMLKNVRSGAQIAAAVQQPLRNIAADGDTESLQNMNLSKRLRRNSRRYLLCLCNFTRRFGIFGGRPGPKSSTQVIMTRRFSNTNSRNSNSNSNANNQQQQQNNSSSNANLQKTSPEFH